MTTGAKNAEQEYITVYKMMPIERFETCLRERGLKASLPYSSANPMENLPQCKNEAELTARIQEAQNHDSVLMSFTAKAESPTLWGLYGDSGAGVCLEFQFPVVPDDEPDSWNGQKVAEIPREDECSSEVLSLHKMSYSLDSTRMVCSSRKSSLKELMLYKAQEWSFEQEYRFVVPMSWASSSRDGNLFYREPLRYLTAVYLGPLAPHSPHYVSALLKINLLHPEVGAPFVFWKNRREIPVQRALFDKRFFSIHLNINYSALIAGVTTSPSESVSANPALCDTDDKQVKHTLLYMYASEAALETILESGSLKASLTHAVNDPMECLPQNPESSEPIARSSREGKAVYLCFSKTMVSPSMWGNYAEEGKGACLAFVFPLVHVKDGMKLAPTLSRDKYKKANNFIWNDVVYEDVRASKNAKDITYRKAKDWEYEQEVRCFCKPLMADSAKNGMLLYKLPMQFLAGVVLGPRSNYATPYIQKKLECLLKNCQPNWLVENKMIPWLLCSRACFHYTKYEFFAQPWFNGFSAQRFKLACRILAVLGGMKFPDYKYKPKNDEQKRMREHGKNWGIWADRLSQLSDDETSRLMSISDNSDFVEAVLRSM